MTAPADSFARDARVIGLVAAGHTMSHMFVFLLLPLSVRMHDELGFSYLEVGILAGAFSVGAAVCQTGIGFVVDRIGGRAPLILGVAVLSGAVMGFGLVSSFWAMLPLAVIGGIANSVFPPRRLRHPLGLGRRTPHGARLLHPRRRRQYRLDIGAARSRPCRYRRPEGRFSSSRAASGSPSPSRSCSSPGIWKAPTAGRGGANRAARPRTGSHCC